MTRNAVKVSAAAARKRRAEEGARAYAEEQRRARGRGQARSVRVAGARPFVVHRYARCLSYPEWGVGTVNGIYFTGEDDDIQQWARVSFNVGIRTGAGGIAAVRGLSRPIRAERVHAP